MSHPLGPCLDLENERYENSPSPSPPFIFSQTPLLEEFVCLGGPSLPETIEFPHPLAILQVGMDFLARFSEEAETRLSNEDSTIKVFSKKFPDFREEAIQESGMQLALTSQDVDNPYFWN